MVSLYKNLKSSTDTQYSLPVSLERAAWESIVKTDFEKQRKLSDFPAELHELK